MIGLYINLLYLNMCDKLYASPLTFEDICNYREVTYFVSSCIDTRETKISTVGDMVNVEKGSCVGDKTKGYIFNIILDLNKFTSFY